MRWVLLLLFGGLGLAALVGGVAWGWQRLPLFQEGVRTTGVVVGQEETVTTTSRGSASHTYSEEVIDYNPVVEFTGEGGETHRFTGSTGGEGKPIIETGSEVEVLYDPADPGSAQIASFEQFWLGPVVVAGAGLIFLLMGVGGFFLMGGQDRRMEEQAAMMQRERLIVTPQAQTIRAEITATAERPEGSGHYVFICRARRPGAGLVEEFVSDFLPFDPGHRFVGREVTVHLDPADPHSYFVNIDPLLPEIMAERKR